jgi:hypothetical protein
MQNHLCRTLAHHLVYLGNRLDFRIPSILEKFILDTAQSVWNTEGHFLWKTSNAERDALEEDDKQDESAGNLKYFDLDVDKWPVYWTEPHYTSASHGPRDAGTSSGDAHGTYAATSSHAIDNARIPAHSGYVYVGGFNRATCYEAALRALRLPLNVPGPDLPWSLTAPSCQNILPETLALAQCTSDFGSERYALLPWLLV